MRTDKKQKKSRTEPNLNLFHAFNVQLAFTGEGGGAAAFSWIMAVRECVPAF